MRRSIGNGLLTSLVSARDPAATPEQNRSVASVPRRPAVGTA
jgi:hypothetical protein